MNQLRLDLEIKNKLRSEFEIFIHSFKINK